MHVAVLGTGVRGTAITGTLIRAGHEVTVWNRTTERAEALRSHGARVGGSPLEAVADADAVLLTLYDADAVESVLVDAAPGAPDAVWVQASTIGLEGTRRVQQRAEGAGIAFLEAMMLGTKAPAENGRLTMLVAGPDELADRVAPVLDTMAAKVVRAGPGPRSGRLRPSSWPPTPGSARSPRPRRSRSCSRRGWASTPSCSWTRSTELRSTAGTPT